MVKQKKIIVVDDDLVILGVLKDMILAMSKGNMDCSILTFSNPRLVLEREIDIRESCLLISDYEMPEMTGIELIQEVKKINSQIKVFIVSGVAHKVFEQLNEDNHLVDKVFEKPFGWKELNSSLMEFFSEII
jgi:two-component SAPR family response regulator